MRPPSADIGGLAPAHDRLVADAAARAGTGNPLLGFGTGAGLPAQDLCTPATSAKAAGDLVDEVAAWLGHPERRVAASLVVLGYAARLVGPTLAVLLRDGVLIDARPARVRYAYSRQRGFTLGLHRPSGWRGEPHALRDAWCATVLDQHLRPLIRGVHSSTPVAVALLWGNVASGVTGALRVLARDRAVPVETCYGTGLALLDHPALAGTGHLAMAGDDLAFRRRSCCLYYRLPGAGTCAECPITPVR